MLRCVSEWLDDGNDSKPYILFMKTMVTVEKVLSSMNCVLMIFDRIKASVVGLSLFVHCGSLSMPAVRKDGFDEHFPAFCAPMLAFLWVVSQRSERL